MKVKSKVVSAFMSLVLALGLCPSLAFAGESGGLAAQALDTAAAEANWEAYGVYGGEYAYMVDPNSRDSADKTKFNSKIVRADGTVTIDLPSGGAYKDISILDFAQVYAGYYVASDLEDGLIRLEDAESGLWGVKRLDGSTFIPFNYDTITPAEFGWAFYLASWHNSSSAGVDYFDETGAKLASISRTYEGKVVASTSLWYGGDNPSYPYDNLEVYFADESAYDVLVIEKKGSSFVERADLSSAPEQSWDSGMPTSPVENWNPSSYALANGTTVSFSISANQGKVEYSVTGSDGQPVVLNGYTLGAYAPESQASSVSSMYFGVMDAFRNSVKHGNADAWWATDSAGKWGAVDSYGKVVVPFKYDGYYDRGLAGTDYALVSDSGAWSFMNVATGEVSETGLNVFKSGTSAGNTDSGNSGSGNSGNPSDSGSGKSNEDKGEEGSKSIVSASVSGVAAKTYTSSAITQSPTVKLDGATLAAGTDYYLSYKNNVKAGTATIIISGKGAYTGAKSVTFAIYKADVKKAKAAKVKPQKYNKGKAVKPALKITFNGKVLKKGSDYTLSYKNNKKRGTATITVKGKGNFRGAKTVKFKIK